MDAELRAHLDALVERNIAAGMPPGDAAQAARRAFGGVAQVAERCRDARRSLWLEQAGQDIRHGLRALRRDLRFAVLAVGTLAVGLGANTAVFSVLHTYLVRPLPYAEPGRLVSVSERRLERAERGAVSAGSYRDWQEQAGGFAGLAAYGAFRATLQAGGVSRGLSGARVTPNLLALLGVRPVLGAGFAARGRAPGDPREVLISHALWQAHFGGWPEVVGTLVRLNDEPVVIAGVMPGGFEFPTPHLDFWLALRFDAEDRDSRRTREWRVIGRLAPGTDLAAAQAAMTTLARRSAVEHPEVMEGWGVEVTPYREDIVRHLRPLLLALGWVVALVLLLACTNVANLMLARSAARAREIALRGALGAGRGRLIRQLVAEAMLLAGLGGVAGVGLAIWMVDLLAALAPERLPGIAAPRIDGTALGFALGAVALAIAVVGLMPAVRVARSDARSALHHARGESGGPVLRRTRTALLLLQVGVTTILLAGTALLLRTLYNLHRVDLGFDPRRLLSATVDLSDDRYRTIAEQNGAYERLRDRLEGIAGVTAISGTSDPPLSSSSTFSFVIAGRPRVGANPREDPVEVRNVAPGYFQATRLPLLMGRDFSRREGASSPAVAIVNRTFARRYFGGDPAVGERISFVGHEGPWIAIVGVAGDVRDAGSDQPAAPAMYVPYAQKRVLWQSALTVLLRTSRDPALVMEEVRRAFAAVDGEFSRVRLAEVSALYSARFREREFMARLFGGFALLALSLSLVGIYGFIAYAVAQRQREFGIRLALGAPAGDIVRRVFRDGFAPVLIGTILGVAGAMGLTRFLRTLLFEVEPGDPAMLVVVAMLLGLASWVALWLPARRAGRIDPAVILRAE